METEIFVYGLFDRARKAIFYIGATSVPLDRIETHRGPPSYDRTPRSDYIRSMRKLGHSPEMLLFECCFSEQDAGEAEQRWIDFGRECRWPLLNRKPAPRNGIKDRGLNMVKHKETGPLSASQWLRERP